MSRYDWMADARCAQVDPDLWHPDNGSTYTTAKQICSACPVRPQCEAHTDRLDADAAVNGRHGMWAARTKSQRERRQANAEREARQAAVLRLIERGGMEPQEIADHVGCDVRTVFRVKKQHREQTASTERAEVAA